MCVCILQFPARNESDFVVPGMSLMRASNTDGNDGYGHTAGCAASHYIELSLCVWVMWSPSKWNCIQMKRGLNHFRRATGCDAIRKADIQVGARKQYIPIQVNITFHLVGTFAAYKCVNNFSYLSVLLLWLQCHSSGWLTMCHCHLTNFKQSQGTIRMMLAAYMCTYVCTFVLTYVTDNTYWCWAHNIQYMYMYCILTYSSTYTYAHTHTNTHIHTHTRTHTHTHTRTHTHMHTHVPTHAHTHARPPPDQPTEPSLRSLRVLPQFSAGPILPPTNPHAFESPQPMLTHSWQHVKGKWRSHNVWVKVHTSHYMATRVQLDPLRDTHHMTDSQSKMVIRVLMLFRLIATLSISGELIMSRYVAGSITTDCRAFGPIGHCQLHTQLFRTQLTKALIAKTSCNQLLNESATYARDQFA